MNAHSVWRIKNKGTVKELSHDLPSSLSSTLHMETHEMHCALQESKRGSKYTLNLAPGAAEKTTPRKAAPRTPKRTQSAAPALDFHDAENTDPFSSSQELVTRR